MRILESREMILINAGKYAVSISLLSIMLLLSGIIMNQSHGVMKMILNMCRDLTMKFRFFRESGIHSFPREIRTIIRTSGLKTGHIF